MPEKPDDRLKTPVGSSLGRPEIFTIIDGKKFPRPGLETVFAEAEGGKSSQDKGSDVVGGAYCSCNKVCTCVPACGCVGHCACVGHTSCSCDNHSGGGTIVTGCRCAPVH